MFNYGTSPLGGRPIPFSYGAGEDPMEAAFGAMQSEAQKRRMAEMMRLAGYESMQYSTGGGGGMGILGGISQMGNQFFGVPSMFSGAGSLAPRSWMQSMPSLSFPSFGGMR